MTSVEDLLYTDRDGNRAPLFEVIDDGVDGGYEDRLPALRALCDQQRVEACQLLVAWSDPAGLEALVRLASANAASVDFPSLADALRTGARTVRDERAAQLRIDAARALLAIADQHPFDEQLRDALLADPDMSARVAGDLRAAIERALHRLERRERLPFDLLVDTAALVVPLARIEDDAAAAYAERLQKLDRRNARLLRQLAAAMGQGDGPRTGAFLERLRGHRDARVRESAEAASNVRSRRGR